MRGDTLYEISRRLGITLEELLSYNPQIVNPDVIEVGQRICVPLPVPPADCEGEYYLVRAGETLSGIARHFGISVQDILRINPQITNADLIYAGQVICIPRRMIRPRPPAPPPPPHGPMPCPSGPGMPYPSLEGPFFVLPAGQVGGLSVCAKGQTAASTALQIKGVTPPCICIRPMVQEILISMLGKIS